MARTQLGEIDLRSGTLVVVDFGCLPQFGSSPAEVRATLEEALVGDGSEAQVGALAFVVARGLPVGRFAVMCERLDDGEFEGMRSDVTVELCEGATARTISLGTILVDTARVGLFDREALAAWNEHEPSDGLADVAFWGGDEDEVARRFGVGRIAEGVCCRENLPYDEAVELGRALHALRESRELRFAFDFRPHTHPFHLLAQIRASEDEAGTLELDGLTSCGFMTTWGDGWFPVELDVDASERPLRVRVVFDTGGGRGEPGRGQQRLRCRPRRFGRCTARTCWGDGPVLWSDRRSGHGTAIPLGAIPLGRDPARSQGLRDLAIQQHPCRWRAPAAPGGSATWTTLYRRPICPLPPGPNLASIEV